MTTERFGRLPGGPKSSGPRAGTLAPRHPGQDRGLAGRDIEAKVFKHHQIGSAGAELFGEIDAAESASAIGVVELRSRLYS